MVRHVLIKNKNDFMKKCMEGVKSRGRPKKTWNEVVEKNARLDFCSSALVCQNSAFRSNNISNKNSQSNLG